MGARFADTNDLLTKREVAKRLWAMGARQVASVAEAMVHFSDPHKSIPNRMLAPYTHYNVLMTGTEPGWMNFFGLRLDGAADPIVRALAEVIWREWGESRPRDLVGTPIKQWHLPYADDDLSYEEVEAVFMKDERYIDESRLTLRQKMSVARCAHLSYTSFETGERMTVEHCLDLYRRLIESRPIHASPAEHQGTPDTRWHGHTISPRFEGYGEGWNHPEQAGNLGPGWRQYRKLLPDESVAQLPEAYR